ncbi:enoyl-CoA hydratase-related protein [Thermocrinis minervae]|uniref:enoyl-CoA hydratase-related protein n=1 Tax=Thermocrinis minervae TaxID=381751 RepID=UPI001E645ABD|nr:enoyl-CoA hydratase-related protein [Thermocrinis minervae]
MKGEPPGKVLAVRDETVCIATLDGAVWITHLREKGRDSIKLPALRVLHDVYAKEIPLKPWESYEGRTYREIIYWEEKGIGNIEFNFYNGAMSTEQCQRLLETIRYAKKRPVDVIILWGSEDFWSNGMNLNTIENAESPADESWRNINAMDDLCEEMIRSVDKFFVCSMQGNAGAGGVFLALAGDLVIARSSVVLNPHYKNIGNLYGSEFWTYLLPKRVGWDVSRQIMENRLPISARKAQEIGLIDVVFDGDPKTFRSKVMDSVKKLIYEGK